MVGLTTMNRSKSTATMCGEDFVWSRAHKLSETLQLYRDFVEYF
jgi:hypothetical protein